jgi:hypothetical protein
MAKAYDKCHIDLALACLTRLGLDSRLAKILSQTWRRRRWLKFGREFSTTSFAVTCLPQGCPMSVVALIAVLTGPARDVKSRIGGDAAQSIYLDDRNAIVSSVPHALTFIDTWKAWATILGLKENDQKTVVVTRTGRPIENEPRLERLRKPSARVLGIDLNEEGCYQTATADDRLRKAVERCKRIKHLAFLGRRQLRMTAESLVTSAAAWGWW